jgi:hypothetical protein
MKRPLLILLEGANDVEFLVRIASRLHDELSTVPDLSCLQQTGRIVLVPLGGGDPASWPDRLRPLDLPEFHLYDREQRPETDVRLKAADLVNARPGCRAALTHKRCLENYLHPRAIAAAGGGELVFGDNDPVSLLLARKRYEQSTPSVSWDALSRRAQRRMSARSKRWLNRVAVQQMTADLLAERDPAGELLGWLRTIEGLMPFAN